MSSKTQFTVLTDRSHGGASLKDGSLELMVCMSLCHRVCMLVILCALYLASTCQWLCTHVFTVYLFLSLCVTVSQSMK